MEQSPSLDTNSLPHYQEIPYVFGLEPPQSAKRQEGKMQPVSYFVRTSIARHDRKFTRSGYLASGICLDVGDL
jgi:hypothetical protein